MITLGLLEPLPANLLVTDAIIPLISRSSPAHRVMMKAQLNFSNGWANV
jgi:hypothetical protein